MLFLWSAQSGLQFEMFLSNYIDMVKKLPPLLSLGESRIWGWPEAARPPLAAAAAFCCCAASIALLWSWIEKKIYKVFAWLWSIGVKNSGNGFAKLWFDPQGHKDQKRSRKDHIFANHISGNLELKFSSPNITGGVNKFLQVRILKYIWIICDFMT